MFQCPFLDFDRFSTRLSFTFSEVLAVHPTVISLDVGPFFDFKFIYSYRLNTFLCFAVQSSKSQKYFLSLHMYRSNLPLISHAFRILGSESLSPAPSLIVIDSCHCTFLDTHDRSKASFFKPKPLKRSGDENCEQL